MELAAGDKLRYKGIDSYLVQAAGLLNQLRDEFTGNVGGATEAAQEGGLGLQMFTLLTAMDEDADVLLLEGFDALDIYTFVIDGNNPIDDGDDIDIDDYLYIIGIARGQLDDLL